METKYVHLHITTLTRKPEPLEDRYWKSYHLPLGGYSACWLFVKQFRARCHVCTQDYLIILRLLSPCFSATYLIVRLDYLCLLWIFFSYRRLSVHLSDRARRLLTPCSLENAVVTMVVFTADNSLVHVCSTWAYDWPPQLFCNVPCTYWDCSP